MPDFLTAPRGDLIRLIYDLIDENNALKAQITELRSRFKEKDLSGKKEVPSFVKPNIKRKPKSKREKRLLNFARKKDTPTRHVFHSYEACPNCGGALGEPSVCFSRQVIDIPLPQFEVTEHVVFKRWCVNCKKRVYPGLDLSGIIPGKGRFGINITSLVTTLNEEFLQPLNKIQNFVKIMFGLKVSEGELVNMLETISDKGTSYCGDVLLSLRNSNVVYADETGSRESGINGYQWSFSNDKCQLLWYHKRRKKSVVRDFVGEEDKDDSFQGIMVSDFLASYNEYNGFHQRCFVHLLRDIKNLKLEVGNHHPPLNIWAKKIKAIYEEAGGWIGPDPNLPPGLQAEVRVNKEAYFKDKLRRVCQPYITRETPMSTLSARIVNHISELFTFIRFPGIDPDNNKAERALRHSVVKRKISGGTRSAKGSTVREILGTLFGTWRLQGLNPLEQTRLLLARAPCQ